MTDLYAFVWMPKERKGNFDIIAGIPSRQSLRNSRMSYARGLEQLKTVASLSINHGFSFEQSERTSSVFPCPCTNASRTVAPSDASQRAKYGIFDEQGRRLFSVVEGM